MATIVESGTVFFTDVPANGFDGAFLCRVTNGRATRWLMMGGTISRDPVNPEQVHFRVELQRRDPATGAYVTVWDRDPTRSLAPGQTQFVLNMESVLVTGLPAGDYFIRLTMLGSAVLLPVDGFFVVAIDMDDNPVTVGRRHHTGIDDTAKVPPY